MKIDGITGAAGKLGDEADVRSIKVEAPGSVGTTQPRRSTHNQEILIESYDAPR